jgi:cytochrome c oxidase subunit 1
MTGKMISEWMGKLHFWLTFIGVNIIFFPMHFLGLAGMPRRIPDYPDAYAGWNYVASFGAVLTFSAGLFFFYIIFHAFKWGKKAPDNPWGPGATTLEWTLSSPPPFHTFATQPHIK